MIKGGGRSFKKRLFFIFLAFLFLFFTASLFYSKVVIGEDLGGTSEEVLWQGLKQIAYNDLFEINSPREFVTCSIGTDAGNGYDYCYAYVELFNNYTNLTKEDIVSGLSHKWNKISKIRNISLFVTKNSEIYNVTEGTEEQIRTYRNFSDFVKLSDISSGAIWAKGEKLYVKLEFEKERWEKVSFNFSVQKNSLNLELDPEVSNCGTLNIENGVYTLIAPVDSSGTCFTISANNITLDCNGYIINYSSAGLEGTYGISNSDRNYTTIKNCNIVDVNVTMPTPLRYRHGISIYRSYSVNIINNNITIYGNTSYGIYVLRGSNYSITNNWLWSNFSSGIYFSYALNSSIINNTGYGAEPVYYIAVSNYTTLINNTGRSNGTSIFFIYPLSMYNLLINNTGISNATVFYLRNSEYNTLINNTAWGYTGYATMYIYNASNNNFTGNFVLANTTSAIDMYASDNCTFINNTGLSNTSSGFLVITSKNNVFIDNVGISRSNAGFYITAASLYNNFTDNLGISNTSYGFYLYSNASNNLLWDNSGASNSSVGFFVYLNSSYNTFINNTGVSNGTSGIYLHSSSNYNTLINNTGIAIAGSMGGISIYNSTGNNLTNNIGISRSNAGVYLWGSSYTNLVNNTGMSNTSVGFYFNNASNNLMINNTGLSNSSSAIYIYFNSLYNTFINNTGISNRTGIHLQQFANYNTLINNTGIGLTQYGGIYTYNCTGNNFTGNFGVGNSSPAIAFLISTNYNAVNNMGVSNSNYGIYLNNASNNLLINNTGISNSSGGIVVLYSSSRNTFINNTGDANGTGIHLQFASDYNTLINNTGITHKTGYAGLYIQNCTGSNLTNNFGAGNSTPGIFLSISTNNTLINNIGISNSSNGFYIYYSNYNNLTGNTGTSNSSYAFYLYRSINNTLAGNNATGFSTGSYGIYLTNQSEITMKDCIDVKGVDFDIYINTESSTNLTVINCSYNISKESVNGAANRLIREWYYSAYAHDISGNPVSNANITAYNSLSNYQFNLTTADTGYTPTLYPIIDYVNVGGTSNYYSDYLISAINSSSLSSTHYWNVTSQQNTLDNFTMESSIPPDINFTAPTPANATTTTNTSIFVNVSTYDTDNHSAFLDWNRSLVLWWNFESILANGSVFDNSSYGSHGRLYGGLSVDNIVSGKRGNAIEFDGINDYIETMDYDNLNISGNFSVFAWIKAKVDTDSYNAIVGQYTYDVNPYGYLLYLHTGVLRATIYSGGAVMGNTGGPHDLRDNQWHHVGLVLNGSKLAIYEDGVEVNSNNTSPFPVMRSNRVAIGLRRPSYGDIPFNGTIDEVMVFSRALTPEEINASYNAGTYRLYRNFTNLFDGRYTYKAYAIDAAGNVNATEERIITIDATYPNINFTFPTPENNSFQQSNSVYINVSTYDTSEHSAFIDWNRSLVGWWNFESVLANGTVYDNSSRGNHGRMINFTLNTTIPGIRGQALKCDGTNKYVIVNYNQDLNITNKITVEAWFYHAQATGWNPVVSRDDGLSRRVWNVRMAVPYGNMSFAVWNQSSSVAAAYKTVTNSVGNWHHLAAIYNGTSIILYIDGIPGAPANLSGNIKDSNIPLYIGEGAATYAYWNGSIDEVRIYNRVLSPEEINASYNAGIYRLFGNFTNLSDTTYTYKAYAIDSAGNVNMTEERTVNTVMINCTNLNVTGKNYILKSDIINNQVEAFSCINISAQNITLDCQGHLISSAQNISGIYSTMRNTTIQNCNIDIGGGNKTNISAVGIYYNYTARYGQILNNVINATYGILLDWYANINSIINNTAYGGTSTAGKAIYLRYASYCNLTSNTGTTPNGYTIIADYSNYNILKDNIGISNISTGFRLGASYHNLLINNTGISTSSAGIYLLGGANNTLINNTGIGVNYQGIRFDGSSNNTFINNIGTNMYTSVGSGIVITSYPGYPLAINNTFINNTFTSGYGKAIYLANTTGNNFYNQIAIGYSSGSQAIYTSLFAMNNTFYNCVNISGGLWDVNLTSISLGNTFVNCSYNLSKEFVGSNSQLIRKWYYQSYANDSNGNPVTAQINATNKTNDLEFSENTNSSGIMNVTAITDYVNLEGTRTYYSPYNLTASNSSYFYSLVSHLFNASNGNNLTDFFTFIIEAPPAEIAEGGGEGGCTYDWVCSEWYPEPCNQDGIQKRVCVNRGTCNGKEGMPSLNRTCTPEVFEPAEPLFDIFVNVPLQSKWILKGDNVSFNVRLLNVGNKTTIDVFFQYFVIDENNRLIAEKKETRAIGEKDEFGINLPLPDSLGEGLYRVYVQIDYDTNKTATAGDSFEVVKDSYTLLLRRVVSFLPVLSIPIIFILVLLKLIIGIFKKRKKERKEHLVKRKIKRKYAKLYKKRKRKAEREARLEVKYKKKKKKTKAKIKHKKEKKGVKVLELPVSAKFIEKRKMLEEKQRKKFLSDIRKRKLNKS